MPVLEIKSTRTSHHRTNSEDEKDHSVQLVGTMDELHGQSNIRNLLGPSGHWEKPHATFGKSLPKSERGCFVHEGNFRILKTRNTRYLEQCHLRCGVDDRVLWSIVKKLSSAMRAIVRMARFYRADGSHFVKIS